jgi:hypothetical protein
MTLQKMMCKFTDKILRKYQPHVMTCYVLSHGTLPEIWDKMATDMRTLIKYGDQILLLEIHACNNPSPVLKRCILSAVASTPSQGGVR